MNTTAHPSTPEEIMAFLDGELASADSRAVADHLEACGECAAIADRFRATSRALDGWSVPITAVHLDQALIERAAVDRVRPRTALSWKPWALGGGVLATAALLLLMASPFAPPPSTANRQAGPVITPERMLAMRKPSRAIPENSGSVEGVMGGIGNTAPPQIARVAGMISPQMLREQGAPSANMAMKARAYAPARMAGGGGARIGDLASANPMIARTVAFTLRVKDIAAARASLGRLVSSYQSYDGELTFTASEAGFPKLQASLRIPAPQIGRGCGRTQQSARSKAKPDRRRTLPAAPGSARPPENSRATEERFRAILQQHTGSVSSILEVEQAIATVREEIERMEAEQDALEHRVTFATINLRLVSQASARPHTPAFSSRLGEAFLAGYHNAMETLFGIALTFAENGPTVLICVALIGTPALLVLRRYRRICLKR